MKVEVIIRLSIKLGLNNIICYILEKVTLLVRIISI